MTLWQQHKSRWNNCQNCDLCIGRNRVCLARGHIPASIVFVGEAPGDSEDILGQPFIGPAGKLLDRIIEDAGIGSIRIAMTNLLACFPRLVKAEGINDLPAESIKACSPRLIEFVDLCKPKGIVLVGKLARKHVPTECVGETLNSCEDRLWIEIIHPAAILRADVSQRGLAIQRTIVAIRDLVEEMLG